MEWRLVQACKRTNNSKWAMRYFTYIVFLFFFLPQITYAQPKPKRDTSKDKSVIDAKRKEEQAKKETELTTEHRTILR